MFRSLFRGMCCGSNTEDVRQMDFSHSLLQDVPSDVFMCERTLEKLYLDSNHIAELPRQLFNCDELRTLNLSDNEINFLPPAISSLINLQKMDISKNSIVTLPDNMKNCKCLVSLNLSVNPLEKFPECLINLVSLNELYLTDVYLEFLPANFGKLINLRILELRENNLVTLPKTFNRLIHLTRLDIGNNEFTELPEVISSLHNLTELWIDGNHIRRLSSTIGHLRKLIHFEASHNIIEVLPRDIGYWTRIVEFSISNNDLDYLPITIGNMKNLVGLKLDDNRLKLLPDSIGKLTSLEELIISHNYLSSLPSSIGLLRKLNVLTADKNFLTDMPSELGSCISLSILSVRGNRIAQIPAEIGHLPSLRVLNLVDNHLSYLPMSLLKLDRLSALWLSTNQSQPLVPLQQEVNPETFQTVLTCFMLPQLSHKKTVEHVKEKANVTPRKVHPKHICFATDANKTIEQTCKLTRAPTPYPKELRALAKHAKNLHKGLIVSNHRNNEKIIQPVQGPMEIKEAKVTATPHNSIAEVEIEPNYADEMDLECSVSNNDEFFEPVMPQTKQVMLAFDSSPVIREAKNIRTHTQMQQQQQQPPPPPQVQQTISMNSPVANSVSTYTPPQPPPYHIAAAYSLKAQFFNQLDNNTLHPPPTPDSSVASIRNDESGHQLMTTNDDDYEPRTFIQDKPMPGQNIIAPTPKRPNDLDININYSSRHLNNDLYNIPSSFGQMPASPKNCRSSDMDSTSLVQNFVNNNSPNKNIQTNIPVSNIIYSKNLNRTSSSRWVFGQHKNATVEQITLHKKPDLGFTITENEGKGIYVATVTDVNELRTGDKILEVEGIDFTKLSKTEAMQILNTNGSSAINMMVSHMI